MGDEPSNTASANASPAADVASVAWWTVRRVANGDARRPWYELSREDVEALSDLRKALRQSQLFRNPGEDPVAYQKALAKAYVENDVASEANVIAAAGRIYDWFSGGTAWRLRQAFNPDFYKSADWEAALNYARSALDPALHATLAAGQFLTWQAQDGSSQKINHILKERHHGQE